MNILDFLVPNLVSLHYTAKDSADVIAHLGGLPFEAGYVHETFIAAALDRESRLPTGLPLSGDISAAPHTEVEHIKKTGLAMATLTAKFHGKTGCRQAGSHSFPPLRDFCCV